ncbi:hypothetical protein [Clostridium sp. OS1-26]|uniref:hypothetical protein n=1 Tax=Clostridium sp. OS1-26 TaxID=3070681 RepID=UPI0027E194A3|nr:hypothetical protein [Clostridium sp. OS1-26]WML37008.1 hypothetical protein RCG18_10560 [Clostridium sp. OS1-26]
MYQRLERQQDNEKAGDRKRLFCCKVLYISRKLSNDKRAKENGKLVQSLLKDNLIQSSKRHLGAFLERYPAAKEQLVLTISFLNIQGTLVVKKEKLLSIASKLFI